MTVWRCAGTRVKRLSDEIDSPLTMLTIGPLGKQLLLDSCADPRSLRRKHARPAKITPKRNCFRRMLLCNGLESPMLWSPVRSSQSSPS
jgi:hypothetical protein